MNDLTGKYSSHYSNLYPRLIFWVVTLLSGGIFWLSAHPPMIDIPQHAAQVALLLDFVNHDTQRLSPFYINYFTPYLLGYGLWCALGLVLPLATALKLLLTVSFWCFVLAGVSLRRQCKADARLDWMMLPTFFGFAFEWGFLTFLISAPLGILFIGQAMRYANELNLTRGFTLFVAGLILFYCHGLIFIMCLAAGGLLSLAKTRAPKELISLLLPYLALTPLPITYFIVAQANPTTNQFDYATNLHWSWQLDRILQFIVFPWGAEHSLSIKIIGTLALFTPLLLGCRINKNKQSFIPLSLVALIWLSVPHFAMKTAFLYERFALFILPFYALIFTNSIKNNNQPIFRTSTLTKKISPWILATIVISFMAMNALKFIAFNKESRDFKQLITKAPEGKRALALILDRESEAARSSHMYVHYASWYQAENRGVVDFSFAWFAPQPVRYRLDSLPKIKPGFEWDAKNFSWKKHNGQLFDLFLVRSNKPPSMAIFKNPDCVIEHIATSGSWHAYRKKSCLKPLIGIASHEQP